MCSGWTASQPWHFTKTYLADRAAAPVPACSSRWTSAPPTPEQRVVRTLVGVDDSDPLGDPQGQSYARLTRKAPERLVDSAARAADVALQGMPGPSLAVSGQLCGAASCWVSTPTTRSRPLASRLPAWAVHLLFLWRNRPGRAPGGCALHNQTMITAGFGER